MAVALVSRASDRMTEAEWQVRVDLAACYRLVHHFGWSDLTATHISARVPGPDHHFLLNPYGALFDEITASSLVKVDLEGRVIDPPGAEVIPAGFVIHSAVHMAVPELSCVLHTHTAAGVGVATQRDGLLPNTQHSLLIYDAVAYHDFEGAATELEERERIVADLGDKRVLILRNHGLLTVGATVGEAFVWMYRAERACRMQLAFQGAGVPGYPLPDAVVEKTIEQGRKVATSNRHPVGSREWPAMLRLVERIDPSYKN
ncbi:ribulose-5-phosphate 4-epimerase/fuculose-1-phosphate aldolase [Stella humosa]|uniref:Ribulose-5-phosphate 4-epimerase/fuculose-1-phosphate aldolase n=1 Tax=Stella humosa TaxID=94 RepID=A0A3N1KVB5_9PROT|nr:class II aldolase/adducin family protein [Stella humosa]ROP81265.1 ribulose-5-phosphate 4-epimerase/fuculose-1-phosphate aldolase [Stella humosa]BBK32613.1 class II aldolase [Stella humosa]